MSGQLGLGWIKGRTLKAGQIVGNLLWAPVELELAVLGGLGVGTEQEQNRNALR